MLSELTCHAYKLVVIKIHTYEKIKILMSQERGDLGDDETTQVVLLT